MGKKRKKPSGPPVVAYVIQQLQDDYPGKIVVRVCSLSPKSPVFETPPHFVGDTIEAASQSIPEGLRRVKRAKFDAKQVLETWI